MTQTVPGQGHSLPWPTLHLQRHISYYRDLDYMEVLVMPHIFLPDSGHSGAIPVEFTSQNFTPATEF